MFSRRLGVVAALWGLALSSGCVSVRPPHPHYDLAVRILPESRSLFAALRLDYVHSLQPSDTISFLLNKNLTIDSLEGDLVHSFRFDTESPSPFPFSPDAGVLSIRLKETIQRGERTSMSMKYSGTLGDGTSPNYRISNEWVELGLYAPWFPFSPETPKLTYRINLDIPDKYEVLANGTTERAKHKWAVTSVLPDYDIVMVASRNLELKEAKGDGYGLKLYSGASLDDSTADAILSDGLHILQRYNEWFGPSDASTVSILISPREVGAAYARKGLIVLKRKDEQYWQSRSYLPLFAHEISHLWWANAPAGSWEDWLNESFAECSALMSIRDLLGKDQFEEHLGKKAEGIDKLPPIRGLDRHHEQATRVLYDKGCCYLLDLEDDLGEDGFKRLMKRFYSARVGSTDRFLEELETMCGADIREEFSAKLEE